MIKRRNKAGESMKKHRRIQREFDQIKKTLRRTEQIVNSTKDKKLWDHEASLRKKIKALRGMQWAELDGYEDVLEGYIDLLDTVSARLLNHYNKQKGDELHFRGSGGGGPAGIPAVRHHLRRHAPHPAAGAAGDVPPVADNPKDEYPAPASYTAKGHRPPGRDEHGQDVPGHRTSDAGEKRAYLAPLRVLA